jgi:hypothetical protein
VRHAAVTAIVALLITCSLPVAAEPPVFDVSRIDGIVVDGRGIQKRNRECWHIARVVRFQRVTNWSHRLQGNRPDFATCRII